MGANRIMETLKDLLIEQLKDLYSAENQLVESLPEVSSAVTSPKLKKLIDGHLKQTTEHVQRLETISQQLDEDLEGHTCKAMKGLIKEVKEAIDEEYRCEALRDIQIVAAAQRVEHYEIAGYGNAIAIAQFLDLGKISSLLHKTIEEEGEADKSLTELCQKELFEAFNKKSK